MTKYLWNLLISLDQFANTAFGGDPDETLSSRWSKWRDRGDWRAVVGRFACRWLDWIDPGHSEKYREPDEGRDAVLARNNVVSGRDVEWWI